jgi:hypothetical protein
MSAKKFGVGLLLCIAASGAMSVSTSNAATWEYLGTRFYIGLSEPVSVSVTGPYIFTSKVLGSPFKLTGTGVEGVEAKVVQGSTAETSGKLKLTGITIDEPAGCKLSGSIETTSLHGVAQMGNTAATSNNVYLKLAPSAGEVLATIKLTECAAAGSYQLKGVLFMKATNPTGVGAVKQGFSSSSEINSSQGGAITLGKEPATLEWEIDFTLTAPGVDTEWRLTP